MSTDMATLQFEFCGKEKCTASSELSKGSDFKRVQEVGVGMSDAFGSEEERSLRCDRRNASLTLRLQDREECRR